MKRLFTLLFAFLFFLRSGSTEPWNGRTVTVAMGTAVRIVSISTRVSEIRFQMLPASSGGVGYVLYAPVGVTCALGGAGTALIAELPAASTTAPSTPVIVPANPDPVGGLDLHGYCVDGAHTGDTILVSWNVRN